MLESQCSTCVFRPGNPMHLQPGRLKDLVEGNVKPDSALTCHQTLPYYPGDAKPAVCRGFFDKYKTTPLRMAEAVGIIVYDPVPPEEEH